MILSRKHKFIFFCNGKTGTTSIEHALKQYDESGPLNFQAPGLWVTKHVPPAAVKALMPAEEWKSYFKFVGFRNPMTWIVSQYRHNFGRYASLPITPEIVYEIYNHLKQFRALPHTDTLFQSSYFEDSDRQRIVDFRIRMETINEDIKQVSDRLGIVIDLPFLNAAVPPMTDNLITDEAVPLIRNIWYQDFCLDKSL